MRATNVMHRLPFAAIQGDNTGRLFLDGLMQAADRGVRVRLLIDDSTDTGRDAQARILDAHPNIEVRVFNPFLYRGPLEFLRYVEFAYWNNALTVPVTALPLHGTSAATLDKYRDAGGTPLRDGRNRVIHRCRHRLRRVDEFRPALVARGCRRTDRDPRRRR
jgi:hypothetical protein